MLICLLIEVRCYKTLIFFRCTSYGGNFAVCYEKSFDAHHGSALLAPCQQSPSWKSKEGIHQSSAQRCMQQIACLSYFNYKWTYHYLLLEVNFTFSIFLNLNSVVDCSFVLVNSSHHFLTGFAQSGYWNAGFQMPPVFRTFRFHQGKSDHKVHFFAWCCLQTRTACH